MILEKKLLTPFLYMAITEPVTYVAGGFILLWTTLPDIQNAPPFMTLLLPFIMLAFYVWKELKVIKSKKLENELKEKKMEILEIAKRKFERGEITIDQMNDFLKEK